MKTWRFLDLGERDIYTVLAINEAITIAVDEGRCLNTLRFLSIKPPAVTLGYFQNAEEEVNLDFCIRNGINIARRWTGGGCAYEDYRGELTYGIMANFTESDALLDIRKSFEFLCSAVVIGLRKLGINAQFRPINDILANGRKIGGVGQSRLRNALLLEGSILLDDREEMFKALKVSREKLRDKGIASPEQRVTSIRRELGRPIDLGVVKSSLREGFESFLEVKLTSGELTSFELALARRLREKYASGKYIFMR